MACRVFRAVVAASVVRYVKGVYMCIRIMILMCMRIYIYIIHIVLYIYIYVYVHIYIYIYMLLCISKTLIPPVVTHLQRQYALLNGKP